MKFDYDFTVNIGLILIIIACIILVGIDKASDDFFAFAIGICIGFWIRKGGKKDDKRQ